MSRNVYFKRIGVFFTQKEMMNMPARGEAVEPAGKLATTRH